MGDNTAPSADSATTPCAWRKAHDALARHGRARIARASEQELRELWTDYCIALNDACDDPECVHHSDG